jgi:hypothetical protein
MTVAEPAIWSRVQADAGDLVAGGDGVSSAISLRVASVMAVRGVLAACSGRERARNLPCSESGGRRGGAQFCW